MHSVRNVAHRSKQKFDAWDVQPEDVCNLKLLVAGVFCGPKKTRIIQTFAISGYKLGVACCPDT